jgi:integrase
LAVVVRGACSVVALRARRTRAALERALEKLRREGGIGRTLTLAEFVDEYLDQHDASPVTLKKLRFLLTRAVQAFGDYRLDELNPVEIAAWRMTVPPGYRFEATQALRQVLARAVIWGLLDLNPAKQGVDNPQRRRTEKRPFDSFTKGRLSCPKTEASIRAVLLQARALAALDHLPSDGPAHLLFPAERGGYLDLHNFRNLNWKPAQTAVGIEPFRRIYDLRHTFATFALRAGISTFELSRYMGASLTMIDRHYGHLACDGREHAIRLLDTLHADAVDVRGRSVDAEEPESRPTRQRKRALSRR